MRAFLSIIFLSTLSLPALASLNSLQFVDCFQKAVNERIVEIQTIAQLEGKQIKICSQLSAKDKGALTHILSYVDERGEHQPYSAGEMGSFKVRDIFEAIAWDVHCYDVPNNIISLWVKGFLDAVNINNHTNLQLVEDAMSKLLSRKMWSENGMDLLSENDLSYCRQ